MSEQQPQLSVEKSEELATVIAMIRQYIHLIDIDYLKLVADKMMDQAGRQEGLAVLLPRHPQVANDLLRAQAKALHILHGYILNLKDIDEMKKQLKHELSLQDEIARLFI